MFRVIISQQFYQRTAVMTQSRRVVISPFCIEPYIHSVSKFDEVQICELISSSAHSVIANVHNLSRQKRD